MVTPRGDSGRFESGAPSGLAAGTRRGKRLSGDPTSAWYAADVCFGSSSRLDARQDQGADIRENIAAACLWCNHQRHQGCGKAPDPSSWRTTIRARVNPGTWHPAAGAIRKPPGSTLTLRRLVPHVGSLRREPVAGRPLPAKSGGPSPGEWGSFLGYRNKYQYKATSPLTSSSSWLYRYRSEPPSTKPYRA